MWRKETGWSARFPDYLKDYLEKDRDILMEAVAETSEEFMDRYFGGEEFSQAEIISALKMNVSRLLSVPGYHGSQSEPAGH